jgi:hypothetical protein
MHAPPTPTHNVPSFRRWRFEMKLSPFPYTPIEIFHLKTVMYILAF